MIEFFDKLKINTIDPISEFKAAGFKPRHFPHDGHWSPLGHKIALQDLKEGDTILKYGHDIGKVVKSIKKGDHVHVHNVKTKKW